MASTAAVHEGFNLQSVVETTVVCFIYTIQALQAEDKHSQLHKHGILAVTASAVTVILEVHTKLQK